MSPTDLVGPSSDLAGRSVRELQAIAVETRLTKPASTRLSRAAQLDLIDALSRWGASGIAAMAGTAVVIAATYGRMVSMRAAVWAVLVFGALYLCRRFRRDFRAGEPIAASPFRWRAYYTSSMAILSAAYGAGGFLLFPDGTLPRTVVELSSVIALSLVVAGFLHTAHRQTAIAAMAPGFVFLSLGLIQQFGLGVFPLTIVAVGLITFSGVWLVSGQLVARASARLPRTGLARTHHTIDRTPAEAEAGAKSGTRQGTATPPAAARTA